MISYGSLISYATYYRSLLRQHCHLPEGETGRVGVDLDWPVLLTVHATQMCWEPGTIDQIVMEVDFVWYEIYQGSDELLISLGII